jgi:hypothetical protein
MTTRRRIARIVALSGACLLTTLLAACGIGNDARPTIIPSDELPPVLANTTTTTTTTPATVPPTATLLTLPAEPVVTTTTVPQIPTVAVTAFFVPTGTDGLVRAVQIPRAAPVGTADVVNLLENPPPQLQELGLTTALRSGLVTGINVEELGLAWVNLDGAVFDQMTDVRQRQAIGQLVLTLTSFTTPDRGNIGSVVFTKSGEPLSIILPGAGATALGEPVGYSDFQSLVDDAATATPSTTTTTSAPPATAPPAAPVTTAPPG